MTLEEAKEAMKTHRVRHRYFSKDEWVTQCSNGNYYFEDGVECTPEEFWKHRNLPVWKDGWEIVD